MNTVSELVETVGHGIFANAIKASPTSVSNMKRTNKIPAKKYLLVCELCIARGIMTPSRSLFSFDEANAS